MVQLGFNLMGHPNLNKDGVYNYKAIYEQFDAIETICRDTHAQGHNTSTLWFRLRGGNGSQRFSQDLFIGAIIDQWRMLQRLWNIKLIYTINYNDVNDIFFYNSLVEAGLKFYAIEMGNEQYLPKFRKTAKDDVTKCVTKRTEKMNPDKYIKFTRQYIDQYKQFNLPMFIQFAPQGKNQSPYYKTWNDTMVAFINNNKDLDLHACIHCYGNDYPYELIPNIKKKINKNVFVTEYGAEDELAHVNKLLEVLGDDDCMMSHELYNDYKNEDKQVAWHNSDGITEKGRILFDKLFAKK